MKNTAHVTGSRVALVIEPIEPFTIDEKRFTLPAKLSSECPACASSIEFDRPHVAFPTVGKPIPIYFYCGDCDVEWNEEVVIDLVVTFADPGGPATTYAVDTDGNMEPVG